MLARVVNARKGGRVSELRLVPIREHTWSDDFSYMRVVSCMDHPTSRYLTKNPSQRNLHLIVPPQEAPQEGWPLAGFECPCPFSRLGVWVREPEYVWNEEGYTRADDRPADDVSLENFFDFTVREA